MSDATARNRGKGACAPVAPGEHRTGKRPLRVLYVQPNSEIGGSDIALVRTIEALGTTRVDSMVVLPSEGPLVDALRAAGARICLVPMRQLRSLPSLRHQMGYLRNLWPTVRAVSERISEFRPDVVHSNSLYCVYGAWAAKSVGVPHLWHVREIPPNIPVLRPIYARMVTHLSDTVLAMSKACVRGLFARPAGPEGTVVMPDALDHGRWAAGAQGGAIREALGLDPEGPVVGFVARLDPWKGAHVFVQACALVSREVPEARFIVAGGAPDGFEGYEASLRRAAEALGIAGQLTFLGWRYTLQQIPSLMAAFTVFCHTSVRPEPFGLVLLEAMSVRTPIIAANAGGPREIIENGETGILAPPGDAEALARAICDLLRSPARRDAMTEKAFVRLVNEYSVPTFRRRLMAIYDDTLERAYHAGKRPLAHAEPPAS